MKMTFNIALAFLVLGIVFLSGCTNYQTTTPAPECTISNDCTAGKICQNNVCVVGPTTDNTTTTTPHTYNVNIMGFAFNPSSLTISAGDTVTWTNQDSVSHTVTSDTGSEISSSSLSQGSTYSHTFNQAGTFSYHCSIHTSMKGTVTVG